jgi:hypothetical protein
VAPSSSTQTLSAIADGANVAVAIPPGAFGSQTVEVVEKKTRIKKKKKRKK